MWGFYSYYPLLAFAQLASLALFSHADPLFIIKDTYTGGSFFNHFDFSTFDDPTHGRVVSPRLPVLPQRQVLDPGSTCLELYFQRRGDSKALGLWSAPVRIHISVTVDPCIPSIGW